MLARWARSGRRCFDRTPATTVSGMAATGTMATNSRPGGRQSRHGPRSVVGTGMAIAKIVPSAAIPNNTPVAMTPRVSARSLASHEGSARGSGEVTRGGMARTGRGGRSCARNAAMSELGASSTNNVHRRCSSAGEGAGLRASRAAICDAVDSASAASRACASIYCGPRVCRTASRSTSIRDASWVGSAVGGSLCCRSGPVDPRTITQASKAVNCTRSSVRQSAM